MKFKKISALILAGAIMGSVMFTGCGAATLDPKAVVATVNGKEISAGLANLMAQYTAVNYDSYYRAYFGDDMWNRKMDEEGNTLADSMKTGTLNQLKELYLLKEHMADYGVELTDEDMKAIETAAEKFMKDNSASAIKAMGATTEYVEEMLSLKTIQKRMKSAIIADVDTTIADDECAQKVLEYVRVNKSNVGANGEASEESASDAKAKAETILEQAQLGSTQDPLKTAAENNGASAISRSFGISDLNQEDNSTGLNVKLLQAADALAEGEICKEIIEVEDAYYVLCLTSAFDKEATESKRESMIQSRQNDYYYEVVEDMKSDVEWTVNEKVWKSVNFDIIYTKAQKEDVQTDK